MRAAQNRLRCDLMNLRKIEAAEKSAAQLVDKVVLCINSFAQSEQNAMGRRKQRSIKLFLNTIPLSKLRFDISLYTRETVVSAEFALTDTYVIFTVTGCASCVQAQPALHKGDGG